MSGWLGVVEVLGALVALTLLLLVALGLRRRWLAREGGTFECSMRLRTTTPGAGWVLGIARYHGGNLQWFRFFSFSARPRQTLQRAEVRVLDSREPDPVEAVSLAAGQRIIRLEVIGPTHPRAQRDLAMSQDSMTGLLAWLESAPPGLVHT